MNPSQQQNSDMTSNFFWLLAAIAGAIVVVWWLERKDVVAFVFFIRNLELQLVKWVGSGWDVFSTWVNGLNPWFQLPLLPVREIEKLQHFMHSVNYHGVAFNVIERVSAYTGKWYRFPVIALLMGGAIFMLRHHRQSRFHHIYKMKTLQKIEVENWPQITPVLEVDLRKQDLDTGPWAMAMLPLDFCKKHNLLTVTEKAGQKVYSMDQGRAQHLFTLQLGPLWNGVDQLPMHLKALLAIFVARAVRDMAGANAVLDKISASAKNQQLDYSSAMPLFEKYKNSKLIKWLQNRHAYVTTLMASLLESGRAGGVLATAEFLWLKTVDRRMWYTLNSVGRYTAVVEVAGVFAHWLVERKLNRALRVPMTKQAVVALEEAVNNIRYVDAEEKWHTTNAA